MDLIIFTHPDNEKSHNAAILRHVQARLKGRHEEFGTIDLYADGFDPLLRLSVESDKKKELVAGYQELIAKAERLIFIFPVWWYNAPAALKGFIDNVFFPGFAYDFNPYKEEVERKLKGKKAIVINTFGRGEEDYIKSGRAPDMVFDKAVLEFCGIDVVSRINWFDVRPPSLIPAEISRKIDEAL
jgi:NAD(P)H dehydrogenase (quinone)